MRSFVTARGGRRGALVRVGGALAAACLAAGLLASCSSAGRPSTPSLPNAPKVTASAPFTGHGGIYEAYALGATPGEHLIVANAAGKIVGSGVADRLGSLIVRNLPPGTGYTFRSSVGTRVLGTSSFQVLDPSTPPPESFYSSQHLQAGLNYITIRDGVKLAATVRLPLGKTLADGPFPTVIEYSGYAIAAPGNLLQSYLDPSAKVDKALLPDTATAVGSIIAPAFGFATVSLQMRGTGCSGGAFDLFGLNTTYDGYDAVQIVASQPWVLGHKVGMVGISFSGISQLFVAGARPPGLAAVAPMSVTNDLYDTGFPGGMLNEGFAAGWVAARIADAQAAPQGGFAYAKALIAQGDRQCLANQDLHLETLSISQLFKSGAHRVPSLYDPRSPQAWAAKIDIPVFLSGALQDEQTGPQWPALIPALSKDPNVWVTMTNGAHIDSLDPAILSRWIEFLDIFLAHRVPTQPAALDVLAPLFYKIAVGSPSEVPPPVRFTNAPDVAAARADFVKNDPRIRVLFDNGDNPASPGSLQPGWSAGFSSWPPSSAQVTTFTLGGGGHLLATSQAQSSSASFRPNPAARPATDLASSANSWAALPPYNWTPVTGSQGLGFVSAPLAHDTVVVGPASLNLMVKSTAPDTDLQVTVSDVLPDGQEMYVTSGFLRASDRALTPSVSTPKDPVPSYLLSTALHPVPTYLASTARPLPAGRYTEVRIPIDPIAHAFLAGSRIRITISAPGGDRPVWSFDTYQTGGKVVDTVALGGIRPSTLVLPVVPGLTPNDPPPACPSLRGEPCRTYVPAGNGG